MKTKISDILRKSNDETMAKIIGAVIAMQIDGISEEEAVELEYPHTLETLQAEIDVDYTMTNAERIRAMSDENLAEFLEKVVSGNRDVIGINCGNYKCESWKCTECIYRWLQSEVE